MTTSIQPQLTCRICGCGGVTHVVEGKAPSRDASWGEVESCYELSCGNTFCLGVLAKMANRPPLVHVDTRAVAQAICVDGLIEFFTADGPEFWACHGCPGCEEAS